MKSYTDLEQSKKLAEILPLESADGWWTALNWQETEYYIEVKQDGIDKPKKYIPCWSLAALLEIIPWCQVNRMTNSNKWEALSRKNSNIVAEYYVEGFDTPIDACYETILKLHELKWL